LPSSSPKLTDYIEAKLRNAGNTPPELDLHLICDNYATHKTPAIKTWLAAHPRFHLHFTPTSGSWINLVERWFAELTRRKLQRSSHRSVKGLETDVTAWIEAWNIDPKPFVWVKTANEILDNLATYCTAPEFTNSPMTQDTRKTSVEIALCT
jgi:transposase